jgi:hypothetical protein
MDAKASFTGNQRWEEKHPEVAADLHRLAEEHAQQDPTASGFGWMGITN